MSDMDTKLEKAPIPKISHPPVQKAHEKLRALSADPEFRRMAQERERVLLEAEMERREAEARGQAIQRVGGLGLPDYQIGKCHH